MTDTPPDPTPVADAPAGDAPAGDAPADDRTRTGRAVSDRWRRRRPGIDAGSLAAQSARFAAGVGRSVIGRRLAGGAVPVADASGLPARPPAAAWRMNEVADDRRVDAPMPDDLSALRALMRMREAQRRPLRVDLPARGLPMVSKLGVSSTAGPRTGPLAAGVRYQPRSAMVDRPPEVAAASPIANPIAPGYAAQATGPVPAQPAPSRPAPAAAPADDWLESLRAARAAREVDDGGGAGGGSAPPADRDRPPAAGPGPAGGTGAPAGPSASAGAPTRADAAAIAAAESAPRTPAAGPAPRTPAAEPAPRTPAAEPAPSATSRARSVRPAPVARPGGIALATVLPLRRQRRAAVTAVATRPVPPAGTVAARPTTAGGAAPGTEGLPVGAPVAVTRPGSAGTASGGTGPAPDAASFWPPAAAALAHHRVAGERHLLHRRMAGAAPVAAGLRSVDRPGRAAVATAAPGPAASGGAPTIAAPSTAAASAGAPVLAPSTAPAAAATFTRAAAPARGPIAAAPRWAGGDAPPTALRPFGMLTGPRPHQAPPEPALPDRFVAPGLRLVPSGAVAATSSPTFPAASSTPVPDGATRPALRPVEGGRLARGAAAQAGRTATAPTAPIPGPVPGSSRRGSAPSAGEAARATTATAAPAGGFPHWPPPAQALARPAGSRVHVLRRSVAVEAGRPLVVAGPGSTPAGAGGAPGVPGTPGAGTAALGPTAAGRPTANAATRAAARSASTPAPRWPHWPGSAGPPGPGDQPRRQHAVRPTARSWATPVDAPGAPAPGSRAPGAASPDVAAGAPGEAPVRPPRSHAEAAERFELVLRRQRNDPVVDLPTPFAPLARALVGNRRVRVSTGRASQAALAAAGHTAATVGSTIHLATPLAPTAAHYEVVAHELTHVAAAPDRRGPRFFGDEEQDEEEGIADMIGRMARSLLPSAITNLLGGGTPAAPPVPGMPVAPAIPSAPALPAMPDLVPAPPSLPNLGGGGVGVSGMGAIGGALAASAASGNATTANPPLPLRAATPAVPPPAPPLPSNTGTAGLPVGGASGFLQALSGALAPGAPPAPRPAHAAGGAGGADPTPPSPPPAPPAAGGLAGGPASIAPPPPSAQQAAAAAVGGSEAEQVDTWGGAPAGRPRTAAELGYPGSVPLSVRDTTITSPAVLEESEVRRIVALIEKRVLAELERRGGRGNGLGGSW